MDERIKYTRRTNGCWKSCLLLLFSDLFCILSVSSQNVRFTAFLPPQELVYVHMDNNAYVQGDTVWYKAYVVQADNHKPTPISRILYVELLDEQGYLQERQQLVVDYNGHANGQFAIRKDAFPGHYELRAYTKWMLNFYDGYFMSFQRLVAPMYASDYVEVVRCNDIQDKYTLAVSDENGRYFASGEQSGKPSSRTTDSKVYSMSSTALKSYKRQQGLFSRVFSVYQKTQSDSLYLSKSMPEKVTMGDRVKEFLDDELNVRFFPEGGHLVDGLTCRVGWEVYDKEGRRLSLDGMLEEDGKETERLKVLYGGRGAFLLTPSSGHTYRAVFRAGGKQFAFKLPDVEPNGCTVQLTQREGKVNVLVGRRLKDERPLRLSITSRGHLVVDMALSFEEDHAALSIDKEDLPLGVNQVTVYDESENVLSDRLFFVRNSKENDSRVTTHIQQPDTVSLRPFTPHKLLLRLQDEKGNPVPHCTVSLSVRDKAQLDREYSRGNILTYLLLQSEIKGFVENPEFYFSSAPLSAQALDLLMMIQGWRRYAWQTVAHAETFVPEFTAEQTTSFTGQVSKIRHIIWKRNKEWPIEVSCSLHQNEKNRQGQDYFQGTMLADGAGRFTFAYAPFYGDAKLSVRATFRGKDKKSDSRIFHDPNLFIRQEYFHPLWLKAYSLYETHAPLYFVKTIGGVQRSESTDYPSYLLPDVAITSRKRPHLQRQKDKPVFKTSFLDFQNYLWDVGWYDSNFLFNNVEFNFYFLSGKVHEFINGQYPVDWFGEQTEVITNWHNGKYVGGTGLTSRSINFYRYIDSLEIITDNPRRPSRIVYRHQDRHYSTASVSNASGPLTMVHRPSAGSSETWGYAAYLNVRGYEGANALPVYGREWNLKGFNRPAEFYSPRYDEADKHNPRDHRRTLYWNPSVTTNAYGEAQVEFYNSASCTEWDVEVEGVTRDGRFVVGN